MQKGLATLEIILAVMIIAVLTNVAVPNATRIIDRAALDYETKRLYSELRFVQSMSRSKTIKETGMSGNKDITKNIDDRKFILVIDKSKTSYQVFRGIDTNKKALREPHYLSNGVTISFKYSVPKNTITFNGLGNATNTAGTALSNTLILTSRLNKKNYIKFDSVGRIRSSLTDN